MRNRVYNLLIHLPYMKKILLLTAFLGLAVMAQAQTSSLVNLKSTPTHVVTDTVVNAAAKSQFVQVPGFQDVLTIQTTVTKVSGTVAGTVGLYGSLDNSSFVQIGTNSTLTDVATQTFAFPGIAHNYSYYRLTTTGSGTMVAKLVSLAVYRKR